MELSEIKKQYDELGQAYQDAESGKITYFQADGLRNRFNYESVSYVGTLLTTIASQQAEIERLRAEMTAIQSVIAYRGKDYIAKAYEIAERNSDIQQQPEPPQESLILSNLSLTLLAALVDDRKTATQLAKAGKVNEGVADGVMVELREKGLASYTFMGWKITAAGLDYLATLEPKEDVVECQSCGSVIPEEHQREYGLEDMCMDCAAKVANARADENKWMYPDR